MFYNLGEATLLCEVTLNFAFRLFTKYDLSNQRRKILDIILVPFDKHNSQHKSLSLRLMLIFTLIHHLYS